MVHAEKGFSASALAKKCSVKNGQLIKIVMLICAVIIVIAILTILKITRKLL